MRYFYEYYGVLPYLQAVPAVWSSFGMFSGVPSVRS